MDPESKTTNQQPEDVSISRRRALKLMGASALLASGVAGCDRKPYRKIVSMAEVPEYQKPGKSLYYASTWTEGQIPYGMRVKTVDGRPVKIEGLPSHPLNRGTANAQMQASLLSLYDPERLRAPRKGEKTIPWKEADGEILEALKQAKSVLLITRSSLGPSERAIVQRFLKACPAAVHKVHETAHAAPRRLAWKAAYGTDGEIRPLFAKARVVLSLDSDFLGTDGDSLEATREFTRTRTLTDKDPKATGLSRLYVVESAMTLTGSNADHRIPLRPSAMLDLVLALRSAVKGNGEQLLQVAKEAGLVPAELEALVRDLAENRGAGVVVAGSHLPESVHAAVALLNLEIEAAGKTLQWNPSPATLPVDDPASIESAAQREGGLDVVIFLGVNPGHDWAGETFDKIIKNAKLSVGHGLHDNETLAACTLALPSAHNLESWNDAAPLPGVKTICQPVIAPLFDARQEAESLLSWTKQLALDDEGLKASEDWHGYVKNRWKKEILAGAKDAQLAWEDALRQGMVGQEDTVTFPTLKTDAAESLAGKSLPTAKGYELVVLPHPALLDGRFAANAWLQELPDPVSKLVWDNAGAVSPEGAKALGASEGDWIEVSAAATDNSNELSLPLLVQPGVAPGVLVTTIGHGRKLAGVAGSGQGVNVTPHLGSLGVAATSRLALGLQVAPAEGKGKYKLVRTQKEFSMHDRPIVLHGTRAEYEKNPNFPSKRSHVPELKQLDPEYDYSKEPKWAMAIDLSACTGCSVCVVACQAENNIAIVGKDECGLGREMHWIRIDRYEKGDAENPHVYQQPMTCQHCDNAPCESVCPVNATVHGTEGLNEQVYNRCVGTRYCANNCPYKVRRFNFYNYHGRQLKDSVQELAFNPQVTVRSRGVMEKCTFCVQRINEVKFRHKNQEKAIPDGAIQTACQQACPAQAIVFGNVNDPESKIAKVRASSLSYHVLEELNVRPNISYLARVTNPPPAAPPSGEGGDG